MHMLVHSVVSHISLRLSIFLYSFFLCSLDCIISVALSSSSLNSFASSDILLSSCSDFSFQLLHFWTPEFPFGSFLFFYFFEFYFIFLYSRFLLVIHFIHISVYMSIPISQFITPPPHPLAAFPPWCPYVCSLHLCLSFNPANRFICTIFLGSTYMC